MTDPIFSAATAPAKKATRVRWTDAGVLLRLTLLGIGLAYLQSLTYGLVYDDKMLLGINPWVESWQYTFIIFKKSFWQFLDWKRLTDYYRPMVMLFFIVMRNIFGPAPAWLHLAVVGVHALATYLVFKMVRRLTADEMLAVFSAVIFGLHPTKVESVAWISGVSDSLCLVFLLGAALTYFRWHDSHQWRWRVASIVLLFLGILSKEVLILGPLIFAVYEFSAATGSRWERYKQTLRMVWPYCATVIAALLLRMNAMPHFTGQSTLYQGRPQYTLFTAPAAFLWYVKQQLFPIETSVQYPLLAVREFSWLQFMFPLLVIAAIGAGVILWSRRSAAARFLIAWGLLTLSPVIAFHIALQLHDRYAYLPSVAMSVGMAYVILRFIGDNKRAQAAVLVALIVGLGWATHRQAKYWSDDITLFEHAVKVAPDHHDAYTGLVAAYDDFGMQEKELETLQRWVAHTPTSPSRPAYTMFLYYIDRKDLPHAREAFERAKTGLRSVTLNVAYARLAMAENRCVDAERYYRLAIIAEPYVMDLHAQLAAAIGCQGRKQEAFEQLKKAWRVRDRDVE